MEQKRYWNSKWQEKQSIGRANPFTKRALSLINEHCLKTVLDLGCGDGRDSLFFAANGLEVNAVDFAKSAVSKLGKELAKKKITNVKCRIADISKDLGSFKDNSFDVIYSNLALHYFRDKTTTEIFNELYRILKKGGLLFIKVKSTEDALYGKGKQLGKAMFNYKNHTRHFFSRNYMEEKLEKFKIIKMRKTVGTYHTYKSSFIEAVATKA